MAAAEKTEDDGLEIPEGSGVTPREERFHRIGWLLLALLVLAALAGLLGPGPLSSRTARAGPALSVEYERFVRNHAPADLRIRVVPPPGEGVVRLHVNRAFLEATQLDNISPEPEAVEIGPAGHIYVLKAPRLGGRETVILYHYQADGPFADIPARVGIEGGPQVRFDQFVYP